MSKIAQHLRALASAARVSMENADQNTDQPGGELSENELAEVAAKAEAEVDAETQEATETNETASEDAPAEQTETVGSDENAETTAEEVPGEVVEETTAAIDETGTSSDEVADDAEQTEAVETEEIQTPAEQDLQEQLQSEAEQVAEAEAAAVQEEVNAEGDTTDAPVGEETQLAADALAAAGDVAAEPAPEDVPLPDAPGELEESVQDGTVGAAEDTAAETTELTEEVPTAQDPVAEETPAPAAAVEEEETVAAPPGPASETSEAVQEVVELTEAVAAAQTAEEVVKKVREVSEGLEDAVGVAEVLNEQGGVSVESFSLLQMSLRPHLAQLERHHLNLGVSMESYSQNPRARLKISLEEIQDLIDELDLAKPVLERQAVESLDRTVAALKDALPSACDRLKAVVSRASLAEDGARAGGEVDVSDGLASALSFNGAMPEDLSNELQLYAQLGRQLLGEYAEKAFAGAKAASLVNNAVNFDSASAFWDKVGVAVCNVPDPRCVLSAADLQQSLPGGGHLFGDAGTEVDLGNEVLGKIVQYASNYAPLESSVVSQSATTATTYPAMSPMQISLVGRALQEVLDCEHICSRLTEAQKVWPEAADAVRFLNENLKNAPDSLDYNVGQHFPMLVRFVETSYSLATWPLINYLVNLVLTVNAFVLYAERSLKAPAAEVAVEPAPAEVAAPDAASE